jgi:hypothetical protein
MQKRLRLILDSKSDLEMIDTDIILGENHESTYA